MFFTTDREPVGVHELHVCELGRGERLSRVWHLLPGETELQAAVGLLLAAQEGMQKDATGFPLGLIDRDTRDEMMPCTSFC